MYIYIYIKSRILYSVKLQLKIFINSLFNCFKILIMILDTYQTLSS